MQTQSQAIGRGSSVLVVRPSSLGDIVHALPIVHDLREHCPGLAVDWMVEETFADLVRLNRGVRRAIPIALRRWRHHLLSRSTWSEFSALRRELASARYDVVLDLQEQLKGALLARLARAAVHGPDRRSVREPVAALFYRHRHPIDPAQHLVDRCRLLAGKAFGFEPNGSPHFDLDPPLAGDAPDSPFAVFLHSTSRDDKLWPEAHWRSLVEHVVNAGFVVVLPWGSADERSRSERLAQGQNSIVIPTRRTLPELASLLARAVWVVGVDTGLTHLAAALGTPTIAIFTSTDPHLAGVGRTSSVGRDLGGNGVVPTPGEAIAALAPLLRAVPSC